MSNFLNTPAYLHAGFPGLWITTFEPERAQADLIALLRDEGHPFSAASWDVARGFLELLVEAPGVPSRESRSPLHPVAPSQANADMDSGSRRVIFLHNYHRFLDSPEVVQALYNALVAGESSGTHYILLAPTLKIPLELEKAFAVFDHPLPSPEQITLEASSLAAANDYDATDVETVVDAARGLTQREVRNVLALSLQRHERFDASLVWSLKADAVKKSGVLSLLSTGETFKSVAGLDGLKRLIRGLCTYSPTVGEHAKGILLTGAPGCGKSLIARAAGSEVNRPVLRMDIGSLMDKHVGESEARLRQALAVAEAIAPCILQVEELEKALAGVGGDGDSGVMRRMFGYLLSWMEERTSPVFVLATSNDTSKLPPEFLRAGRWSCEVFVDLPTPDERAAIWDMYCAKYSVDRSEAWKVNDEGWAGSEVKQACYLAAQFQVPLPQAARMVRVGSRARKGLIDELRSLAASSQMLSATTGEPYVLPATTSTPTSSQRRVTKSSTSKEKE